MDNNIYQNCKNEIDAILKEYGLSLNPQKHYKLEKLKKMLEQLNSTGVDFHNHSLSSMDGRHSIDAIVEFARDNNVSILAISDHNTMQSVDAFADAFGYKKDAVFINYGGTLVVPAVEVTCKMPEVMNEKNRPAKFHLLVYAPDRNPDSKFMKILKMKQECDIAYAMSFLVLGAKELDIPYTKEEIESLYSKIVNASISGISKNYAIKLLDTRLKEQQDHYVSSRDNWDFIDQAITRVCSKIAMPKHFELNISHMIKLAKECGAICILAHPQNNLFRIPDKEASVENRQRAIDILLEAGIDGFEKFYGRNKSTKRAKKVFKKVFDDMNKAAAQNKGTMKESDILFTQGSDFHRKKPHTYSYDVYTANGEHQVTKTLQDTQIMGTDLVFKTQRKIFSKNNCRAFITALQQLQKDRNAGVESHLVDENECESILQEYENNYDLTMKLFYGSKEAFLDFTSTTPKSTTVPPTKVDEALTQ